MDVAQETIEILPIYGADYAPPHPQRKAAATPNYVHSFEIHGNYANHSLEIYEIMLGPLVRVIGKQILME